MTAPTSLLPPECTLADLDGDGSISGIDEFDMLHHTISSFEPLDPRLRQALGAVRQASAPGGRLEPTLGARQHLWEVPQLTGVAHGIGSLRPTAGPSLGTGSIQDALNTIASRLSDHSGCAVDTAGGRYRGHYGAKTENAVRAFQGLNGLPVSGEVDARTLSRLDERLAEARTTRVNDISRTSSTSLRGLFFGDRFGRKVNLTFDDGPHPRITPAVLRILDEEGIRGATFFVLGKNVALYPQIVRSIVDHGHVLANHTYDHPNLTQLTATDIRAQLQRTQAAVDHALGRPYPMRHMRPPYGAVNERVKGVLAADGMNLILWQVDSEDWRNRSTPNRVLTNVFEGPHSVNRGGGALLFHDIQPATEQRLRAVAQGLAARGFEHVSTQDLLDAKYA